MAAGIWEAYWRNENNHDWWTRPAPEVLTFIAAQSSAEKPNALDLGCGPGRHAVAFAQAGFRVTATDASEAAIAYLNEWAHELKLSIRAMVSAVLADDLPPGSFDIVLSYNVIYHGYQAQFAKAIEHVRALLKPAGLFFFTCPTRRDGKYGYGEQVAPHTYRNTKSITPGDIHYFADEADLDELLIGLPAITTERRRVLG